MTTDTALIEKREELKRRLAAGEYKTLVDVFLAWTNRVIQRIARQTKPLPLWLITIILILVLVLITFGAIYITGGLTSIRNIAELFGYGLGYGLGVLSLSSIGVLSISTVIIINQFIGRIIVLWRDDILDATESVPSLQAFEDWLEKVCNRRLHLLVAIFGCLFFVLVAAALASTLFGVFISNGFTFGIIFVYLIGGAIFYQTTMVILLTTMLRRYDLKLFVADPATSELVSRLSGELAFFVYFLAFSSAIFTLTNGALSPSQATGIVLVLFLWLPIIAMFVLNQTGLSSIIRRAKWKTLNEIQAKVETLQEEENFGNQETMDAIKRLMDYHDRVKATRDSALDFRTYLSFINSLLLPLLAFILGNLDLVLNLFARKP